MDTINKAIALLNKQNLRNGKSSLGNLGFLSCNSTVHIKHVPIYEPCLILVLSGRKVIYERGIARPCGTGYLLAVPGPASYDLRNEPEAKSQKYAALLIPFHAEMLNRLAQTHRLLHEVRHESVGVLVYEPDDTLYESIAHYLSTNSNAKLQAHRLMEILLVLATRNPALLSAGLIREEWTARVRTILSADIAKAWNIHEVCQRLATTESTLRRKLTLEGTQFREVLFELRLATALTQLMQTSLPINRIAYDCGYQSVSRFTSNFHKRFGVPPSRFRSTSIGNDKGLTA